METLPIPSPDPLNLDSILSRIGELEEVANGVSGVPSSGTEELLAKCTLQLESKVKQIVDECSDVGHFGDEDLETYLEHLKEDLHTSEFDLARISAEIEVLSGKELTDAVQFESNLEELKCSFEYAQSQVMEKGNDHATVSISQSLGDDEYETRNQYQVSSFIIRSCVDTVLRMPELLGPILNKTGVFSLIMKLESQIAKSNTTLNSLQNRVNLCNSVDAIEQAEDLLSGVKVLELSGSTIRLALRTCVPNLDLVFPDMIDGTVETSEVHHDLLIETNVETMELKDVKIFPSDVYIGEIVYAMQSFRETFSRLTATQMRSPMEWFVGKVQDRVAQCALRQLIVKELNKNPRFSLQYLDRDECIYVHFAEGVDASLKVSQGWPISRSPLNLISLKSQSHSSSLLRRVEEVTSSLDIQTRHSLSRFLDAIGNALNEKSR